MWRILVVDTAVWRIAGADATGFPHKLLRRVTADLNMPVDGDAG